MIAPAATRGTDFRREGTHYKALSVLLMNDIRS